MKVKANEKIKLHARNGADESKQYIYITSWPRIHLST